MNKKGGERLLARYMLRTGFIYLLSILLIIMIVYFPRDAVIVQHHEKVLPSISGTFEDYIPEATTYIKKVVLEGDLGVTKSKTLVIEEVKRVFPRTMKVILTSFFLIICLGILKGIFDYRNRHRWTKLLGDRLTSLTQSFPDFFFIIALIWILLFYFPFIDVFEYEKWYAFILPSLVVTVYPMTYVAKITCNALITEQGEQYVQVSYAKGFKDRYIVYRHMLQNSLSTVFSNLPSLMLLLLSNLLILELFLDYKGAAYRLYTAIPHERELMIALALMFMTVVFATQIVSHLLRYYFDPRERSV